jgi:hypothetical protein
MKSIRSFDHFLLVCLALLGTSITSAMAATVPVGVHNGVLLSTITGTGTGEWGWTQIYRDDYGLSESISTMFAGHGTYVMLGGIEDGSSTVDVLAAISWTDFNTYTAKNVTNAFNGAEWYNNNGSLGFAKLGDTIAQGKADTGTANPNQRLSWETWTGSPAAYSILADHVYSGYRSGNQLGLPDVNNTWDRIIFTNISPVPVPAAVWLFGTALNGLVGFGRRKAAMI